MIEKIRLYDLITLQRGFDITTKQQIEGDVPVISSGGVSSYHNQYKIKGPGVIIGRKGTLGKVFYSEKNYWPHDTTLWVKDFKGNDPKFIFYFLQLLHFEKFDAGAANPTLNRNHVHALQVNVPIKKYRKKIASILSAYDDLIENNKRRIQLLEEMAEEIYKEWFVRMRFPGYENTRFFNEAGEEEPHGSAGALPEGWEKKGFDSVADYINGFAFKPSDWYHEGLPIIKISELKNGVTDSTPRNSGINVPMKLHIKQGELLFSWSADLNVYIWNEGEALLNQHIFKVIPKSMITKELLFFSLKRSMPDFKNMSNGATMHHIRRGELGKVFFNLPSNAVINSFTQIAKPMIQDIGFLKQKNQLLQQTRDLLLPRLISGKLSVEHLLDNEENQLLAAEPEVQYQQP